MRDRLTWLLSRDYAVVVKLAGHNSLRLESRCKLTGGGTAAIDSPTPSAWHQSVSGIKLRAWLTNVSEPLFRLAVGDVTRRLALEDRWRRPSMGLVADT